MSFAHLPGSRSLAQRMFLNRQHWPEQVFPDASGFRFRIGFIERRPPCVQQDRQRQVSGQGAGSGWVERTIVHELDRQHEVCIKFAVDLHDMRLRNSGFTLAVAPLMPPDQAKGAVRLTAIAQGGRVALVMIEDHLFRVKGPADI